MTDTDQKINLLSKCIKHIRLGDNIFLPEFSISVSYIGNYIYAALYREIFGTVKVIQFKYDSYYKNVSFVTEDDQNLMTDYQRYLSNYNTFSDDDWFDLKQMLIVEKLK